MIKQSSYSLILPMVKNRLYKPTLFFVLSLLLLLYLLLQWVTNGFLWEGWGYRVKNLFLPVVAFMVACDVLLKWFIQSLQTIWIIEFVVLLGIIYYWIVR